MRRDSFEEQFKEIGHAKTKAVQNIIKKLPQITDVILQVKNNTESSILQRGLVEIDGAFKEFPDFLLGKFAEGFDIAKSGSITEAGRKFPQSCG